MARILHTAIAPDYSATIDITRRSALQVAPEAFFFEVTLDGFDSIAPSSGVYDARLHNVYYRWDFGDDYTYQNVGRLISAYQSSRYQDGPIGSHTYRAAGTYTVTCTVTEPSSGKEFVATRTITVDDPDTVFTADAQTIIVDSTDTGLAAYPSATVVTTFDAAMANIKQKDDDTLAHRVLIRRGQTHSTSGQAFGQNSNSLIGSLHVLAAVEAGVNPIINSTTGELLWNDLETTGDGNDKDLSFQNIDFVGGWDTTTETGADNGCFTIAANPPMQFLLDGCLLQNFGDSAINSTAATGDFFSIYMNDSLIDGWRDYGLILDSNRESAFTGTAIKQNPLANAGGTRTGGGNNNQGPLRQARPDKSVIHSCDFYSRCDWLETGGIYGQQPNSRFDTDGDGGGLLSMHGNVFEGGNNIVSFGVKADASNRAINAIIAQNYFLASHATRIGVLLNKGGITFRSNVITIPDVPEYSGYDIVDFVKAQWDGEVAGEEDEPIFVYGNTYINLTTTDVAEFNTSGFTATTNANNVVYQPNIGAPETSDGPLVTTELFTPIEPGYVHNSSYGDGLDTLQTAYATPASSVWTGALDVGSGAIGDQQAGPIAYRDHYGQIITQSGGADRGAIAS